MKKENKGICTFIKIILVTFTASYTIISLIWQFSMHTKLKDANFINIFTQNESTNSAQKMLDLFVNNTMPTILYYSIIVAITFGALAYIIKDAKEINEKYSEEDNKKEKIETEKEEPVKEIKRDVTKKAPAKKSTTTKKSSTSKTAKSTTTKKTASATKKTTAKPAAKKTTAKKTTTKKTEK